MRNPFSVTAYIAAMAALAQGNPDRRTGPPLRPVGGHRNRWYLPGPADQSRIEAARLKRERKGAKLQRDYDRCLANNPCRG